MKVYTTDIYQRKAGKLSLRTSLRSSGESIVRLDLSIFHGCVHRAMLHTNQLTIDSANVAYLNERWGRNLDGSRGVGFGPPLTKLLVILLAIVLRTAQNGRAECFGPKLVQNLILPATDRSYQGLRGLLNPISEAAYEAGLLVANEEKSTISTVLQSLRFLKRL